MVRSRAINAFGAFFTGLVLVVVLVTKFTHGAWVALLGMVIFYVTMTAIRATTTGVSEEIAAAEGPSDDSVRPSRVHSIVLVSKIHRPTLRALAYAKLMRSDTLEALSVNVDPAETKALRDEWERRGIDVPLKVLDSPVPRDHPAGHRVREGPAPGVSPRDAVSRDTSPSTWSATGTSTCCTTRARCGSRAGCCSRPASWSPPCPTSWSPPRPRRSGPASGRSGTRPGAVRRGPAERAAEGAVERRE